MRLRVQAPPGTLASQPDRALSALADIAEADGADRDEWLEKALRSAGATSRRVEVRRDPTLRIVADVTAHAVAAHQRVLASMKHAIRERLERAAREADTSRYQLAEESDGGPRDAGDRSGDR